MKLQSPRGTRDFYPAECAWRNYLVQAWRTVSIRNGFEEVDGPIFESLDLYKVKSGEGIVSELFHFQDRGERDLAIRPEFTPTLARMVAAKANSLPRPIKWYCVPNLCRAERPQRGRLREFWQWNCDIIGVNDATADAESIFTMIDLLRELGLRSEHVVVKISHRTSVRHILQKLGVPEDRIPQAFNLLDRRDKMEEDEFRQEATKLGLDEDRVERFEQTCRRKYPCGDVDHMCRSIGLGDTMDDLRALDDKLTAFGIADWCEYDLGIVRGLAYYTGTVYEVHERSGAMRAMAGGGRYDQLVELFGGPSMPAVGFGMGDVVLTDVLVDKGLVPENVMPRPDAFVVAMSDTQTTAALTLTARLRAAGLHARFSYKTTRNLGKLLKDADACRARYAVIIGENGEIDAKKLADASQQRVTTESLMELLCKTREPLARG
ncbi:MAG: histidine--tRNA ligase [Phycisphaeraceae bacterium]|nr:histidine--tRNA ligase [Phycisphaeraceae bacterium]